MRKDEENLPQFEAKEMVVFLSMMIVSTAARSLMFHCGSKLESAYDLVN